MRSRGLLVAGLAACAALIVGGVASGGAPRAATKVTIKLEGSGDFFGFVKSEKPRRCADGRLVILFRQRGSDQDPRNDERVAQDDASRNGDRYMWSTGNTGLRGKFYARAPRTERCKADNSKTVRSPARS